MGSDLDERLRRALPPVTVWATHPPRAAAVLCPLLTRDGLDHVVLIARPGDARQHAGQLAFPGGMRDGDETVVQTALRETHEELGLPATAITVLGGLGQRDSSSGIQVHAVVARVADVPLCPDAREVARVLFVPLHELRDAQRWQDKPPPNGASGAQPRTSPHFAFGDELLWGLTGRFVRDLLAVLD